MAFPKLTIRDVPLDGKVVLVRTDYNVPLNKDGTIRDDLRIKASLPTLKYLMNAHCKVVLISHLGRPTSAKEPALSLEPVAIRLAELLTKPVNFVDDCYGDTVRQAVKIAQPGSVTLLQNVRYYPGEEQNDPLFAAKIAKSTAARYFVQDGFGVVHRAHATTSAITQFIPSVAGLLLEKEYQTITAAIESPKRPLVAILGGAKVSDKIGLIEKFIQKADVILVGGALANTILDYKGYKLGVSMVEQGQKGVIDHLYGAVAKAKPAQLADDFVILPRDVAVGVKLTTDEARRVVPAEAVSSADRVLDIGDGAIEDYINVIKSAGTVIWNGTVGYAELAAFAHGSARIALALATQPQTTSIIGGGDTADFVNHWSGDTTNQPFTHVSTGGGASLDLMAGQALPGVTSLLDAAR